MSADIVTRLPAFDDPDVQTVYALLCGDEAPPNREEHWEGWLARRIVAVIRPLVADECARIIEAQGVDPAFKGRMAWAVRDRFKA